MEQEIIQKYVNGSSISQLLREYPQYNRRNINKMLFDNNIAIHGGRKRKELTPEQIDEAKQMINDGAFLHEIATHFGFDKEVMKKRLAEQGL